jgi:hypothetical protein
MKTSTCRSCGAGIAWARTVNGKVSPFDLKLSAKGLFAIDDRTNPPEAALIKPGDDGSRPPGFTSHFATCPQARHWRRK